MVVWPLRDRKGESPPNLLIYRKDFYRIHVGRATCVQTTIVIIFQNRSFEIRDGLLAKGTHSLRRDRTRALRAISLTSASVPVPSRYLARKIDCNDGSHFAWCAWVAAFTSCDKTCRIPYQGVTPASFVFSADAAPLLYSGLGIRRRAVAWLVLTYQPNLTLARQSSTRLPSGRRFNF